MVAFLKKPEGSAGFHQIVDFLNSTHIKGEIRLFTEASKEATLKLEDSDGIILYLNRAKIFKKLALMGINSPIESHHTPTVCTINLTTTYFNHTLESLSKDRETNVPHLSCSSYTNVADEEFASTGVDVDIEWLPQLVTSL
ncbi:hypothetical protein Tco_1002633 [Tanacetum coccineum]|uniref:Uncharacterized protein n=1 Tax=Tanacetum coccineum TaxID=301880 RepID=A0ABQ5F855_9ASTR